MKELKLLPEDWKCEIDYSSADVAISPAGFISLLKTGERIEKPEVWNFYRLAECKLIELTPEPRPADSIKLSECDGKHVITVDNSRGYNRRITYETHRENSCWYVRDFDGKWCQRSSCLVKLVEEMKLTNIKIYDMSK